jgi:hypothetical protein
MFINYLCLHSLDSTINTGKCLEEILKLGPGKSQELRIMKDQYVYRELKGSRKQDSVII